MSDTFADKYPLHTKMKAEEPRRAVVQEVLDWISEQGWEICEFHEGHREYFAIHKSKPDLIGQFFDVDPQAFDREKTAMLDAIRAGEKV